MIVVLNISSIIDMSWVETPELRGRIGAILCAARWCVWRTGRRRVIVRRDHALRKTDRQYCVLTGGLPSASCWGSDRQNIYQEDIYVGYRYFETFCPQRVQYPFGFGLSYTSFTLEVISAEVITDPSAFN